MTRPYDLRRMSAVVDVEPLTVRQAAERATVSVTTMRDAIAAKELPVIRRGRLVRVLARDVDNWLLSYRAA